MNPSGDFGKKELSPALRNRFSEIWCPSHLDPRDSLLLLNHLLPSSSSTLLLSLPSALSRVSHWMNDELQAHGSRVTPRDLRTMAEFVGKAVEEGALEAPCAVVHAVSLVLCDGLPMLDSLGSDPDALRNLKHRCRDFLSSALNHTDCECLQWLVGEGKKTPTIRPAADRQLQIGPFLITTGEGEDGDMDVCEEEKISRQYCFSAPTVSLNALRVVRALWLSGAKPVLLEGPPGIGKSAVVQAMAELAAVGTESRARRKDRALVRINLSEQTDVADLFGSDLPEEGAAVGRSEHHHHHRVPMISFHVKVLFSLRQFFLARRPFLVSDEAWPVDSPGRAESGQPSSAGGTQRLPGSQGGSLHTRTRPDVSHQFGHEDFCYPEPSPGGVWQKGTPKVLPQQVRQGVRRSAGRGGRCGNMQAQVRRELNEGKEIQFLLHRHIFADFLPSPLPGLKSWLECFPPSSPSCLPEALLAAPGVST